MKIRTLVIIFTAMLAQVVSYSGEKIVYEHDSWLSAVAFSADGNQLALGTDHGFVTVRDSVHWKKTFAFQGYIKGVAFSPNGKWLITGGRRHVDIWDLRDGKLYSTLQGHTDSLTCVAFSPDGKLIASGSGDDTSGSAAGAAPA